MNLHIENWNVKQYRQSFSRAIATRCRRWSCVIDHLLSVKRHFIVENILSALMYLQRFKRFACDGGCNICAAETVACIRGSSVGFLLLKTTTNWYLVGHQFLTYIATSVFSWCNKQGYTHLQDVRLFFGGTLLRKLLVQSFMKWLNYEPPTHVCAGVNWSD